MKHTRNTIVEEYNDHAWLDFHGGTINDQDDLYDYLHNYIDGLVTYSYDCHKIIQDIDSDYYFHDHDLYGRPEDVYQAAYNLIYDIICDHEDTVAWSEMEEVLNEK